jgi:hypothetical protein
MLPPYGGTDALEVMRRPASGDPRTTVGRITFLVDDRLELAAS